MGTTDLKHWADILHDARTKAQPIEQLSKTQTFSRADAYTIQELGLLRRTEGGESPIGWKMGLTSEAKRRQMNLDSPLYGVLTDRMQISNGGTFALTGSIHPKIEPEIAFLISKDLRGPVTRDQVLGACKAIAACMEILDSRYSQFKYFSMEDVIADNSSSSHFVVGEWVNEVGGVDLKRLPMEMLVDGKMAQAGLSSDISGDPVVSVIQLCELLSQRDTFLKAGSIVLAGAATAAVALEPGMQVELKVPGLPSVQVSVSGSPA